MEFCCSKPSKTWSHKRQRKGPPTHTGPLQSLQRTCGPANTLISDFWPGTMREHIPVVLSHQVCYVSSGRLIQIWLTPEALFPAPHQCYLSIRRKRIFQTPRTISSQTKDLSLKNIDFLLFTNNVAVMNLKREVLSSFLKTIQDYQQNAKVKALLDKDVRGNWVRGIRGNSLYSLPQNPINLKLL